MELNYSSSARGVAVTTVLYGVFLILVSISVFVGWAENITILKSLFPGIVSMNPHTALCFLLAGISFILLIAREKITKSKWIAVFIVLSGCILITLGFVRMLGILGIVDLHLDQVLFHAQLIKVTAFSNNRIAPNTACNLIILGVMLILLSFKRYYQVIQVLASIAFLVALLAIVGYLYEVHNLYGFLSYTPMALNTAICFCISSFAVFNLLPKGYFIDVFISKTPGGLISRRLVPAILFTPLVLGFAVVHGILNKYYDANYALALFTVTIIGIFLIVMVTIVYRINTIDLKRVEAEEEAHRARMRAEESSKQLDARLQDSQKQNEFLENSKRAMLNLVEDLNTTKKDLEREKNKDEALLESIGDAVFALDEKGIIILFNPVAEELSGVPAQTAIGKPYADVLRFENEDTGVANYSFIIESLAGKKSKMESHTVLVTPTGERIPVSDSASPLIDANGTITGSVVVFRDITHEHDVDKAKTEFVSLASHQLRTPLSAIAWYSELLLDGDAGKITKKQKDFLNQISQSNARMVDLVNSLLNVSRIDMGTLASDPEPTDIVAIAESVLSELKPQILERAQNVRTEYSTPSIILSVDPRLMRIIIQNLLTNAVKYTPEKGIISITLSLDATTFHCTVVDTGYGIPKDQQDKIFTKLFRADNAKEKETDGNGLGLYVVKSVVETHGGKIWFESEENEGTTFYVELPAAGMKKFEGSKTLS